MRQFPVDRRTLGTKRSLLVDENGIPLRCVPIDANRRDSPLLRSMLEKLGRLEFDLPEEVTVHLDARYDSPKTQGLLTELGYDWVTNKKDEPSQVVSGGLSSAPSDRTPSVTVLQGV